jgi:hypothetical protein
VSQLRDLDGVALAVVGGDSVQGLARGLLKRALRSPKLVSHFVLEKAVALGRRQLD